MGVQTRSNDLREVNTTTCIYYSLWANHQFCEMLNRDIASRIIGRKYFFLSLQYDKLTHTDT
jgi:hypothetical protein